MSSWAQTFAITLFALLATAQANGRDTMGKMHAGGARYVTRKRRRHGRIGRKGV